MFTGRELFALQPRHMWPLHMQLPPVQSRFLGWKTENRPKSTVISVMSADFPQMPTENDFL